MAKRPTLTLKADVLESGDHVGLGRIFMVFKTKFRLICKCGRTYTVGKNRIGKTGGNKSVYHCGSDECLALYVQFAKLRGSMIGRCYDPKHKSYTFYGKLGTRVCLAWRLSTARYVEDLLKAGWKQGLQVDREDTFGDYTPDNIRLVSSRVNNNNRRNTKFVRMDGVDVPISYASEASNIPRGVLAHRVKMGWDSVAILGTPVIRMNYLNLPEDKIKQAQAIGINRRLINQRLRHNWRIDEALSVPVGQKRPSQLGRRKGRKLSNITMTIVD